MNRERCRIEPLLLQRYADGELTIDQDRSVRLHLQDCQRCRREVQQLQGINQVLVQIADPIVTPEPGFAERMAQNAFTVESDLNADFRGVIPMVRVFALVAAAAALLLGVIWWSQSDDKSSSDVEALRRATQLFEHNPNEFLNEGLPERFLPDEEQEASSSERDR